jgi:hypothetical protein
MSQELLFNNSRYSEWLAGSHLLAALGRIPNTKDIGLELTGVETTGAGYIKTNERRQTTAPGVWAIGALRSLRQVLGKVNNCLTSRRSQVRVPHRPLYLLGICACARVTIRASLWPV